MNLDISNIQTVAIIDDKSDARESMVEIVEDADYHSVPIENRIDNLSTFLIDLKQNYQAAVFDHNLKAGNFADFWGAEAVAKLNYQKFPALLVTRYSLADLDRIRPYRKNIPVIIQSEDAESKLITSGFEKCINEFNNIFTVDRASHKALLRVDDLDEEKNLVYVVIPAWNPETVVKLPMNIVDIPKKNIEPNIRLYARINIGAKSPEDLYFENFKIAEEPDERYTKFLHN